MNKTQSPQGQNDPHNAGQDDTGRYPPPRKRLSRFMRALSVLGLLALGAVGYTAYDAASFMYRPAARGNPKDVTISIAPGATFDRVAWDLYKAKAITSVWRFRLLAQARKKLGAIQAGEFQVNSGWTPGRILQHLVSGRPLLYPLTLREGLAWWEVARLVEENGFARASAFKEVIHDQEFLRACGIPFANAEGFLFPETYHLRKPRTLGGRTEAEAVARVLVEQFWQRAWPLFQEYAARSGESGGDPACLQRAAMRGNARRFAVPVRLPELPAPVSAESLRRLVILATLVEKETGVPGERARVAGVYANRLRLGMPLQCDPTIIYGLGEGFSGAIRKSQLADPKNIYNTYLYPGLPPGPICSPGFAALRAAVSPEQHKYLYFVATGQTGAHEFSSNLEDHNKAVARYRASQRQ